MTTYSLSQDQLILNASTQGERAKTWVEKHAKLIEERLLTHGVILIRGLNILSAKQFGDILGKMFGSELLEYSYRSTPRTALKGKIYTATEYHPDEYIPMHNENSYANTWPLNIGFLCQIVAEKGGETPLADSRLVYDRIPSKIRGRFEKKGVMYVRNYGDVDLPWSEVFQTSSRQEVESFCRANGLKYEWKSDNKLCTWQVNQATIRHPQTNEWVWFNQAHLFHITNLKEEIRDSMLSLLGEENLPRNTYYGDGSQIGMEELEIIRQIYEEVQFTFPWCKNDFLLLDNMLFAHGRRPFQGDRKVLVGMSKPYDATGYSATDQNN